MIIQLRQWLYWLNPPPPPPTLLAFVLNFFDIPVFFLRIVYSRTSTTTAIFSLVSTSQQRPPLYNGHFLLSTRWPLYGDSTVFSLKSIMRKCMISEAFILNFLVRKSRCFIRGLTFNQENTVFQQQVKLLFYISKTEGRNERNMQSPKFCRVLWRM